jgi:hypothetical protein
MSSKKKKDPEPDRQTEHERFRLSRHEFFCINQIDSLDGIGMVLEPRIFREWSLAWGPDREGNYPFREQGEETVIFVSIRIGSSYGP